MVSAVRLMLLAVVVMPIAVAMPIEPGVAQCCGCAYDDCDRDVSLAF